MALRALVKAGKSHVETDFDARDLTPSLFSLSLSLPTYSGTAKPTGMDRTNVVQLYR